MYENVLDYKTMYYMLTLCSFFRIFFYWDGKFSDFNMYVYFIMLNVLQTKLIGESKCELFSFITKLY